MNEQATMRGPFGSEPQPKITTPCPACGARSLFIGSGGHLTCAVLRCPNPGVEDAWSEVTHAAGRMAMDVLQDDIRGAKETASYWRIDFDSRGPFFRWLR